MGFYELFVVVLSGSKDRIGYIKSENSLYSTVKGVKNSDVFIVFVRIQIYHVAFNSVRQVYVRCYGMIIDKVCAWDMCYCF